MKIKVKMLREGAKLPKLAQILGCTIDALFADPHEEVI